jgi:hypothetical protein
MQPLQLRIELWFRDEIFMRMDYPLFSFPRISSKRRVTDIPWIGFPMGTCTSIERRSMFLALCDKREGGESTAYLETVFAESHVMSSPA